MAQKNLYTGGALDMESIVKAIGDVGSHANGQTILGVSSSVLRLGSGEEERPRPQGPSFRKDMGG